MSLFISKKNTYIFFYNIICEMLIYFSPQNLIGLFRPRPLSFKKDLKLKRSGPFSLFA